MVTAKLGQKPIDVRKIICIGRNYVEHIQELGNELPDDMVVFMKPGSSLTETLQSFHQEPLHYECELAFMIVEGEIKGVGLGLDLTKRALQSALKSKGLPWERAKAFVGSVLLSEFVVIDSVSEDLEFELRIDDVLAQAGSLGLMMYKPEQIVSELKTFLTLDDHDVVLTGTPKGVGQVYSGQTFEGVLKDGEKILIKAKWLAT